jgi:unsaturated rhamnogalacturonyl hydrolase
MTPATRGFSSDVEARLRLAAERLLRYEFKPWFYGDSVGFEGLLAAAELFDDHRYSDFAHGFLQAWAARDVPRGPDDNTAPGLVLCDVAADTGDPDLVAAAGRLSQYLAARRRVTGTAVTFEDASRSMREPYGEVALNEADRELLGAPGAGIYVDCLHFDPPFYAALSTLLGEADWGLRATEEANGYISLLQDPESGLFNHFWLERRARAYGPGWGRGQGWALLGLLDVVDELPLGSPGLEPLEASAARLLEAMLATQRADGSWHAVAGVEASGDETSTAAFMTAGFLRAARLGVGDPARLGVAAERAWSATIDALDESGLLSGVSAAVYSSTADEHYYAVPRGFDVPWGQGPLLVAAAEVAAA